MVGVGVSVEEGRKGGREGQGRVGARERGGWGEEVGEGGG